MFDQNKTVAEIDGCRYLCRSSSFFRDSVSEFASESVNLTWFDCHCRCEVLRVFLIESLEDGCHPTMRVGIFSSMLY